MLVLLRNKARDSGEAGSCAPGEPGEVGLEAAPAAWRDVSGEPGLSAKLTDLHTFCERRAAWGWNGCRNWGWRWQVRLV